ncbi:hypothetical protein V8E55_005294 [Tylopilus felleus]
MSTNQLQVSLYGSMHGSLYFATVMSTAFYGVTCMQTFFYFVHYQGDPLYTKIFVATLWVLNTVHEALMVSGVYKYLMAGFVNPCSFPTANTELVLLYLLMALVAVPSQGFFVYRLYVFSRKNIVAPLIWAVLALIELVCATFCFAGGLHSAYGHFPFYGQILTTICFSVPAGVDILIAIFATLLVLRERTATNFAAMAHILQLLAVIAVNTGIWTATFALLTLIMLHLFPSNLMYTVFGIPICSIYCNTVLANLNARAYLRGDSTTNNIDLDLFRG